MAGSVRQVKMFVRRNITPKVSAMHSFLGYADRAKLAEGLQQLNIQRGKQRDVIQTLKEKGILKSRFDPASVDKIQPFMLRAVQPSEAKELFIGTETPLKNIASGLEASWINISANMEHDVTLLPPFKTALLYASVTAAGIGATLAGVPAGVVVGGGMVYSVLSSYCVSKNIFNPHSAMGKICEFGTRFSSVVGAAAVAYGVYMTAGAGGSVIDTFISKKHIALGLGGLAAIFALRAARDIKDTYYTNGADSKGGNSKGYIRTLLILANAKHFTGTSYLSYRTLLQAAFMVNAAAIHLGFSPAAATLGVLALAAITIRVGMNKIWLDRKTETFAKGLGTMLERCVHRKRVRLDKNRVVEIAGRREIDGSYSIDVSEIVKSKKTRNVKVINEQVVKRVKHFAGVKREIISNEIMDYVTKELEYKGEIKPVERAIKSFFRRSWVQYDSIDKMWFKYCAGMVLKYGALCLLALTPFVAPGMAMRYLFDLATAYFGMWTLFADGHSQFASMTMAENVRRSLKSVDDMYISDADRSKAKEDCTRLVAYVGEPERNFAKTINTFLIEYPKMAVAYCFDGNPYASLNIARSMRTAKKVFKMMEDWKAEIYGKIHASYKASRGKSVRQALLDLADVFDTLGHLYYPGSGKTDESPYIDRIKKLVESDKSNTSPDRMFNLAGEAPYIRQSYDAIRIRGYRFRETARHLREMARERNCIVSREQLNQYYLDMLGNYSVTFSHVIRKLEWLDDKLKTKIFNLSWIQSHLGDTLYQVWRMTDEGRRPQLKLEHVPSTYVRIKNPSYNHLEGEKPENKKYLWLRREDILAILGPSQSMSNDIKLVDNTPENIKNLERKTPFILRIAGREVKVHGFYSNVELLMPRKLIDWKGHTVGRRELTWIAGEKKAPRGFEEKFREWARSQYPAKADKDGKLKGGYDAWINAVREIEKKEGGNRAGNPLWFVDEPQVLITEPTENRTTIDEAYIVVNTEREQSTELRKTAKTHMTLAVTNFDEWEATCPSPAPERDIRHVRAWDRMDASVGIRYTTTDGRNFDIPYSEERTSFISGTSENEVWKNIAYGLVKKGRNGKHYIIAFSAKNQQLGVMETSWPSHMHPAEMIKTVKVSENGRIKEYPRIEFDVFPERTGSATWLMADYGTAYGREQYERQRFVRLDFDREAKQRFHPNFRLPVKVSPDGKKVTFRTVAANTETMLLNKPWAGITDANEAKPLELDSSGEIYIDPHNHTWSPKKDSKHTDKIEGGIILMRDKKGKEKVVPIRSLPRVLSNPEEARKVIRVELSEDGNKLEFVKLRTTRIIDRKPGYVYHLPMHLYDSPDRSLVKTGYRKLRHILDTQELTVRFVRNNRGGLARVELYDEQGKRVPIDLSMSDFVDNDGKGFLQNPGAFMDSLDSFYEDKNGNYSGIEEFRPRLIKDGGVDGKIQLVLTRVERVEVERSLLSNNQVFDQLAGMDKPCMYFAVPTTAVKVQIGKRTTWIPHSLSDPIYHRPMPNIAHVSVKAGGGKRLEFDMTISKDLPKGTVIIRREGGKYYAYAGATKRKKNNDIVFVPQKIGEIDQAVAKSINAELDKQGVSGAANIRIEVFHTRGLRVVNGEFQTLVYRQPQHGTYFADELYPAALQAQMRDELFYGVSRELFSEAFPQGGNHLTVSIQRGKNSDRGRNGEYTGKPIESGSPCMEKAVHISEMAETMLGLPEGSLLAFAPALAARTGGLQKAAGKEHYLKVTNYCRELGWLSGVSEDEQQSLALALALGYTLKFQLKCTAFEAQPNTYSQLVGQDCRRYNTAMALAIDVLMPYELREKMKYLLGRRMVGTIKRSIENLNFRFWYEWTKAKLIREFAPPIFIVTDGEVKTYLIDPLFLDLWGADFAVDVALNTYIRQDLGRTRERTGKSSLRWTLLENPAMNQAFFFPSFKGRMDMLREGWQYGPFPTTALEKSAHVPEENKKFLRYLMAAQLLTAAWAMHRRVPAGVVFGTENYSPWSQGFGVNATWGSYQGLMNLYGLHYIRQCEVGNPEALEKLMEKAPGDLHSKAFELYKKGDLLGAREALLTAPVGLKEHDKFMKDFGETLNFQIDRARAVGLINMAFERDSKELMEAYNLIQKGHYALAKRKLKAIIGDRKVDGDHPENKYKDPNMVLIAETLLEKLGIKARGRI